MDSELGDNSNAIEEATGEGAQDVQGSPNESVPDFFSARPNRQPRSYIEVPTERRSPGPVMPIPAPASHSPLSAPLSSPNEPTFQISPGIPGPDIPGPGVPGPGVLSPGDPGHSAPSHSAPSHSAPVPTSPGLHPSEAIAPAPPAKPRRWERQPYSALLHLIVSGGTLTAGWFLGILVAQLIPGNPAHLPLQEAFLRRSSRSAQQLLHLPRLWQSPTAETRIEAIPIPETGGIIAPLDLPPIERQPLIDELNAVETEMLTLDRRLQTLEKQLGKPPYQGADLDHRVNALRDAIDPPAQTEPKPSYTPVPQNPNDTLLDVAALKITLPSDALFVPAQSTLKDAPLLNQVLDQLVNYPEATIVIRAYSDNQLSVSDSRDATLAQAIALSTYLQTTLPTTHRWVTIGGGQSQPITQNEEAAQRQQNRRIEILVDTR
ncbi:MAG: OmpA family protein [Phormidesmis sp.]